LAEEALNFDVDLPSVIHKTAMQEQLREQDQQQLPQQQESKEEIQQFEQPVVEEVIFVTKTVIQERKRGGKMIWSFQEGLS
jgi:hypothetical protein